MEDLNNGPMLQHQQMTEFQQGRLSINLDDPAYLGTEEYGMILSGPNVRSDGTGFKGSCRNDNCLV